MRTLDRYIATLFLKNFLLGAVGLTALVLFQAFLGELFDGTHPVHQLIKFHTMLLPQILVQMMPPAVMLATVLTLSGLNRQSELIACFSLGVSLKRIIGVMLTFVFMVGCLMLVFQDRILPPLFKKRTTYYQHEMRKKNDFYLDFRKDKIWYRSKNLIYNLKTFNSKTNTIHGVSVYAFDDQFNLVQLIEAEKAEFTPEGWKLQKGTVTIFPTTDPFPLTQTFLEKELQINEKPEDFLEIEKEVDGLRLLELSNYIKKIKESGLDYKAFQVKYHSRWSLSFIPVVMCFLGVPFSLRGRREGGIARDLGLCLGVTFLYWLFNSISLSLGASGSLPPVLAAWIPSAVFGAIAGLLISRTKR